MMEVIERYIYAVTKRLPQSQREDIEKELRGLIEDMLSERTQAAPDKADIEAVLKELGEPSQLADKYRDTKRYLIGPEFIETYYLILKIVLAATVIGVTVGSVVDMIVNTPTNIINGLARLLGNGLNAAASAFAWVTVIFAINENIGLNKSMKIEKKDWSVKDLPVIPAKEAIIKKSEPIFGIAFAVFFIILFNFAGDVMGAYFFEDGKLSTVIPVFSETGINKFIPLITVLFSISILKESVKLIIGKWTISLGLINAVLSAISLVFCIIIFTSSAIWNANFINDIYSLGKIPADLGFDPQIAWKQLTNGFIYVVAIISIIDIVTSIYKSIKYKLRF